MVTHSSQYYDDEEPSFHRRYSGRGHGYPITHDRDLPSRPSLGPYDGHRLSHDSRSSGQNSEQEQIPSNPRRRIPVACGRCRKRKIRCSGDPGNGGPCQNCKNAGNETCQFLRVSSTEAQMKGETPDIVYESSPAGSRLHCRMAIPYGPPYAPVTTLGLDGLPAYRHGSISYQYPAVRNYYSSVSSTYGDYQDENVDYGSMPSASYPLLSSEHLGLSSGTIYSPSGSGRGWAPAPQLPKSTSLFLDQDSAYAHAQYHPASFPLRPTISHEGKHGLSLGGMATSLPTSITSTDRPVLPYPSAGRQVPASLLRSNESMNALQGPQPSRNVDSIASYSDTLMTASMMKALNSNAVIDNSSISTPYLSSNAESLPSSQIGYSSQALQSQQQNEIYTPSSVDGGSIYGIASSIDGNRSSEDLRYTPGSSSKRPSLSHGTERTGSISEYSPKLSNGRTYEPHLNNYFPTPPMATGTPTIEMSHRRLSGIQAL